MADRSPTNRMSPIAIVILVAVAVIAVMAFSQWRGSHTTPSGVGVAAKSKEAVMPVQATAPLTQQPASDVPWAKSRDSRPNSPNEEGGTEHTAGGTAQGGPAAGMSNTGGAR